MILTVTLNPAYDVTYRVDRVELGSVHRVSEVLERPGGKGVNVSRVLTQLGVPTVAMGFADAAFAESVGVPADFEIALPRVRRTVVIDAEVTTSFWEPGASVSPGASDQLLERIAARLPTATGVMVSGSLPGGVDAALPARIVERALTAGVPVICDVDGEALRRAALVRGMILKPNRDERRRLGRSPDELIGAGVRAVIATAGADGMTVTTADGTWSAHLPEPLTGNATGAGDAAAAAVIAGLATGSPWPAVLADAVATAASAVVRPVAGEIDLALRARLLPTVEVH